LRNTTVTLLTATALLLPLAPSGLGADAEHLPWRASYAQALREARVRNLPVWVTRHKDG
jgi:hypothetical protein